MTSGSRRVVLGVTGTLSNLQALRAAVDIARERNAVLHAVHVWETGDDLESVFATAHKPGVISRLRLIEQAFDEAMGGPRDLDVRPLVVEGRPWYRLSRLTEQATDLLVVGAAGPWWRRGRPATDRGCVRHARCPVLVVPPPEGVRRRPVPFPVESPVRRRTV